MSTGKFLIYGSLVYSILIAVVFIAKKKINTIENKLFSYLLFTNLAGIMLEILNRIAINNITSNEIYAIIANKSYLIYLLIWIVIFAIYIIAVSDRNSVDETGHMNKKVKTFAYVFCIIGSIIVISLPVYFYNDGISMYSYGPAVYSIYIINGMVMMTCFFISLIKAEKIFTKKYMPLIFFIVLGSIATIIQLKYPAMLLVTNLETFITIMMFFTMENPDIKLVEYVKTEKDRAIKLSESKTEFLSNMSKELRTPLASIIGISEDLETYNVESNDIKEDVRDISNASKTLLEIIANIMDISKIEGGKFDITPSDYNPKEEFESLAKIMRTKVNEKPIEFTVKISETLPEVLFGDRVRIKQIINNFLSNAIKYTEKGNVDFIVEWYDASQSLFIKVSDTGRGVKPEDIDRLFAKYDRLSVEKVSTVQGTGLGLAITKEIIEMMGGEIKIESEFGKGTSFMVTLPQQIGNKERYELANKDNDSKIDFDFSGKKILIIDDNQLNIKTLRKTLKSFNLQIDECYTGKEGIEKVAINNYDLILTDIGMPEMNGEEVLSILKSNPNFKTPVLAITAEAMTGAKEKYLEMGFDDYILKPVTKKVIANKLNKFLNKQ